MTLTITEIESIVPEIQQALRGTVFAGVVSPNLYTCVLSFAPSDGGATKNLVFSRRPRLTRLNLESPEATAARKPGRGSAEAARFVEIVSRTLAGALVGPMRPRFSDRVVSLDMLPAKDSEGFGSSSRMTFIFECTGMHPNIFLIDERQTIVAVFGRSMSHKRDLDVGCRYQQPCESDGAKPVGRRVDVMRFVDSGVSLSEQISRKYDVLDDDDDKRRDLSALGESLGLLVQNRRRVADSVRKDLDLPIREGRPADLHDRLRERLNRVQKEIDELQELLTGVRAGRIDQVDRARELVREFEEKEVLTNRGGAARPTRPPRQDGGYQRRDNNDRRPPRPEGGYQRRDDNDRRPPRPPRPEGGYQRRDDNDRRPPRPEGGYQRRDDNDRRPPRPEGGYQRRDDNDRRLPRPEGGYQRRDDNDRRQPRPEGGYQRRDDNDRRPPRPEGGYQRRDDNDRRQPRPEGGYQRRDDNDRRPPRPEGGYQRRDNNDRRPPSQKKNAPRQSPRRSTPRS